jgi:two-component system sensor histidine kinase EvgS
MNCSRITGALLALMATLVLPCCALADEQAINLHGRSRVGDYSARLSSAQQAWLNNKGTLTLGTSAPDYAPFDIVTPTHHYEGLTADYAKLLGELLQVNIKVKRYDARFEAIQALKKGEIDLLGSANSFDMADAQLATSSVYADDQPTLVTRSEDATELPADLAGKTVAMLYHYLPPDTVQAFYPQARLALYPSALAAMGAVAFGQADVYVGDALSAHFIKNRNHLENLELAEFSRLEVQHFSFAVERQNRMLLNVVNSALQAIPTSERMNIQQRWSAGGIVMPGQAPLNLSPSESRWLEQHPVLRVAMARQFLPMTFLDQDGQPQGISIDVLARISARTKLKFDFVTVNSVPELMGLVADGKADLVAALIPSTSRQSALRFTRPYLSTPFVLVSRNEPRPPKTLGDLAQKNVAIIIGNDMGNDIARQEPQARLVDATDASNALAMVADGKADATVSTLISASYTIAHDYKNRLAITTTLGDAPAQIALATPLNSPELYSILEKALMSLSPEEMNDITQRWRRELIVRDSFWQRHQAALSKGAVIAAALLTLVFFWIAYLRKTIRQRKQIELALSDQLEFMHTLVDGTPHPIYVRDREGRLIICNASYLQAMSLELIEPVGKTILKSVRSNQAEAQAWHTEYLEVMSAGVPRIQDKVISPPGRAPMTIYHWMLPYRGSNGEVAGLIAGWIDISERQQLLGQLQEARDSADQANRAKTTFLAAMSHEIRTPLNAVVGMLELAMRKAEQGKLDPIAIEVASQAADDLLGVIGDILDITRIESGHLVLTLEQANLIDLVDSVVRLFAGPARHKGVRLDVVKNDLAGCDVLIDPVRFKQVLSNLLSNAIKFTDQGVIIVTLTAEPMQPDETLAVQLLISDSGRGISERDQAQLFKPFSQASNHAQSPRSGTGLGLLISRTLCELMGGSLNLSSALGQGTDVEMRLSLKALKADPPTLAPVLPAPTSDRTLSILVVDDYPANRLLLTRQLKFLGHEVSEAENGSLGLAAWQTGHFDVVITDCDMPVMDGYTLTRIIRRDETAKGVTGCLILGFTANAQPEEHERCREAGMNGCLFKPLGLAELRAQLTACADSAPADTKPPQTSETTHVSLHKLEQLTLGDKSVFRALVADLHNSTEDDLKHLARHHADNDLAALARLAHRVLGGARIVDAGELIVHCERLQEVSRRAMPPGAVDEAVSRLQLQMRRLLEVLAQEQARH